MARYGNTITKTTTAAAGPIATLSAGTGRDLRIFQVTVSLSTAVSGDVGLMRPANTPTAPTGGQVGAAYDNVSAAGVAVTANAWTTAPTAGATSLDRIVLPASIGAGVIWTYPEGLVVPTSGFLAVWQYSAAAVSYVVSFKYEE